MAATNKVRQGGEALLVRPAATTRAAGCRGAQPGGGRPGGNPAAHCRQTWPTRPSLYGGRRSSTTRWGYRDYDEEEDEEGEGRFAGGTRSGGAMPKPLAGFVLDDQGRCIAVASKHIVTIVRCSTFSFGPVHRCRLQAHRHHRQIDGANNRPLECIIRRVFSRTQDHKCLLLCLVDMPVQVLKSTNFNGWIAVDDDQVKQIIPSIRRACRSIHNPHASPAYPVPRRFCSHRPHGRSTCRALQAESTTTYTICRLHQRKGLTDEAAVQLLCDNHSNEGSVELEAMREKRVTRSYTQTTYTGWRRWARIEQGGGDAQPQYKQVKLHEVSSAQHDDFQGHEMSYNQDSQVRRIGY